MVFSVQVKVITTFINVISKFEPALFQGEMLFDLPLVIDVVLFCAILENLLPNKL
jgi:hypothetical protein